MDGLGSCKYRHCTGAGVAHRQGLQMDGPCGQTGVAERRRMLTDGIADGCLPLSDTHRGWAGVADGRDCRQVEVADGHCGWTDVMDGRVLHAEQRVGIAAARATQTDAHWEGMAGRPHAHNGLMCARDGRTPSRRWVCASDCGCACATWCGCAAGACMCWGCVIQACVSLLPSRFMLGIWLPLPLAAGLYRCCLGFAGQAGVPVCLYGWMLYG